MKKQKAGEIENGFRNPATNLWLEKRAKSDTTAFERHGNTLKCFKGFCLEAKPRIWP